MSEKEQVEVTIDSREDDKVVQNLAGLFNANRDVSTWWIDDLPAADLEIAGVGFERKTLGDYASSLLENRLTEQVVKLGQRYEHAYILVEDDLRSTTNPVEATHSNLPEEALRGSMASITAREGIPVIPVGNRALLADMAVRLARKHIEESDRDFLPKGAVEGSDVPTAKKMYGCLPGVGPTMAERLYERWPSIGQFVDEADLVTLQEIEGIGEGRAKQILEGIL